MWISKFDYFSINPKIMTLGESAFKTGVGAIFTLLCLIVIIVASCLFGRDFYLKETPRVFTESISSDTFDNLTINSLNLNYMFRIEDPYGNLFNFTNLLSLQVQYYDYEYNSTSQEFELTSFLYSPSTCNASTVTDALLSKDRNLSEWYCLNYTDQGINFGGSWSGSFVYYWSIAIDNCPISAVNCTKQNDLREIFTEGLYFSMYYPTYYFSPGNFEKPLSIKYVNQFTMLSLEIENKNRLYFKNYLVEDDRGWIFKDIFVNSLLAFDTLEKNFNLIKPDSENMSIYSLVIYLNSDKIMIHRNYMKIQELAALVGGFMKMVVFLSQIIVAPYNSFYLNQKLFNLILSNDNQTDGNNEDKQTEMKKQTAQIFQLKENKNESIRKELDLTSTKILSNKNQFSNFQLKCMVEGTQIRSTDHAKLQDQKSSFSGPRLLFPYYLWYKLTCRKSSLIKSYELSLRYLNANLDIATFLITNRQFESFKLLFLNYYQNQALRFVKRPNISNIHESDLIGNYEQNIHLSESIIKYFVSKHNQKTESDVDIAIIQNMEPSIKKFILSNCI